MFQRWGDHTFKPRPLYSDEQLAAAFAAANEQTLMDEFLAPPDPTGIPATKPPASEYKPKPAATINGGVNITSSLPPKKQAAPPQKQQTVPKPKRIMKQAEFELTMTKRAPTEPTIQTPTETRITPKIPLNQETPTPGKQKKGGTIIINQQYKAKSSTTQEVDMQKLLGSPFFQNFILSD